MTDAYKPSDQLHRPGGIPPEAEAVFDTPTVPPAHREGTAPVPPQRPTGQGGQPGFQQPGGQQSQPHGAAETAKEEAAHVRDTAAEAGRNVAGTAKEEARNVASEAKTQARQLWDTTVTEVQDQARTQTQRAAEGMHTFGGDMRRMASESGQHGLAAQLAGEVGDRVDAVGSWLDGREPADLLDEVKRYARRHPGAFIAVAGVAGLVVGRLTRGMIADAKGGEGGAAAGRRAGAGSAPESRPGGSTQGVVTDWDVPAQTGHQPQGTGIPTGTGIPSTTGIPASTGVPTATGSGVPTAPSDPARREGGL